MTSTNQFTAFQNLYSKPCLLEANISVLELTEEIKIQDISTIGNLEGKKGLKIAKKIAPLVFHNLLLNPALLDDSVLVLIEKQEAKLKASSKSWYKAYEDAVMHGIRPSLWIFKLNKAEQILISREAKEWKKTHESIEKSLSQWIVANADYLSERLVANVDIENGVSLRKLSKWMPAV